MRFDEAESEAPKVFRFLKDKPNFFPYYTGPNLQLVDCRIGTGGLWLYGVLKENFRVPRERKQHKTAVAVVNQQTLAIGNHAPEIWGLR
jgi:hypothetical protein